MPWYQGRGYLKNLCVLIEMGSGSYVIVAVLESISKRRGNKGEGGMGRGRGGVRYGSCGIQAFCHEVLI